MSTEEVERTTALAKRVRLETVRLVGIAKSGHYSSVFSCAEILVVLYGSAMRMSDNAEWPERDRLVLSKGHVAVGLYSLLADRGYFPTSGSITSATSAANSATTRTCGASLGIDFSFGSLGHGLSISAGQAVGARMRGWNESMYWCPLGDQELNEGQIWEAAQFASHCGLSNLVAIVDRNQMGLDGMTEEVMSVEPIADRFESFGWTTTCLDGHDVESLLAETKRLRVESRSKPHCIIANTVKGNAISYMELSRTWHLGYLAPADEADALRELETQ